MQNYGENGASVEEMRYCIHCSDRRWLDGSREMMDETRSPLPRLMIMQMRHREGERGGSGEREETKIMGVREYPTDKISSDKRMILWWSRLLLCLQALIATLP